MTSIYFQPLRHANCELSLGTWTDQIKYCKSRKKYSFFLVSMRSDVLHDIVCRGFYCMNSLLDRLHPRFIYPASPLKGELLYAVSVWRRKMCPLCFGRVAGELLHKYWRNQRQVRSGNDRLLLFATKPLSSSEYSFSIWRDSGVGSWGQNTTLNFTHFRYRIQKKGHVFHMPVLLTFILCTLSSSTWKRSSSTRW